MKAERLRRTPTRFDQMQADNEGLECLKIIRKYYKDYAQGFEACTTNIVQKMDHNFVDCYLTCPWRDGGRDAGGHYQIAGGRMTNAPLRLDCALEAKCYNENNGVGVKEMSRLISRIRYRQFGIFVITSYVSAQAYQEVVDDGHPIVIVTATDIARILRQNSIFYDDVGEWLNAIDQSDDRMKAYMNKIKSKVG